MNGRDFLILYGVLAFAVIIGGSIIRAYFSAASTTVGNDDETSPYEVACLGGGPARAVHAAIAQLCQEGLVSVDAKSGDVSLVQPGEVTGRPPIEQAVLRSVAMASPSAMSAVQAACAPATTDLEASLRAKGLLLPEDRARLGRLIPAVAFAAVQLLGVIRFVVGLSRHKPVMFLVFAWIVVGVIGAKLFSRKLYRTKRGEAVLTALRARYAAMKAEAAAGDPAAAPAPGFSFGSLALPLAVGVFGYSVLAGTPADSMYQRMRTTSGGDFGGGGDGGSSGDGGGDSGGGGCGGCGGGD